jgi:hypothetical protein
MYAKASTITLFPPGQTTSQLADSERNDSTVEQPLVGYGADLTHMTDVTGFKPQHTGPLVPCMFCFSLFTISFAKWIDCTLKCNSVLQIMKICVFCPNVSDTVKLSLKSTDKQRHRPTEVDFHKRVVTWMDCPPYNYHTQQIAIPHDVQS